MIFRLNRNNACHSLMALTCFYFKIIFVELLIANSEIRTKLFRNKIKHILVSFHTKKKKK